MKWMVLVAIGCNSEPTSTSPDRPTTARVAGNPNLGACSFEIDGAVRLNERALGGVAAIGTSYWDPDDKRATTWNGKAGLVINCAGRAARLSFSAEGQTSASLPFAPKRYPLADTGGVFDVRGYVEASRAGITGGKGFLEITAFDERHVAGRFELETRVWNGSTSVPTTIRGQFDLLCPLPRCTSASL